MVLFTDNDIILKLAAFDLLDATVELLQGQEICVLEAAVHRFRKPSAKSRQLHDEAILARALRFCERATPITSAPSSREGNALQSASYEDENGEPCRMDGGELILFVQAYHNPHSLLVTGDKKSIYALGRHAKEAPATHRTVVEGMVTGLSKRVVCLEAALLALCKVRGFGAVCESIAPHCECDTSMKVVFSRGTQTSQEAALAALDQYLVHAERSLSRGWLWRLS